MDKSFFYFEVASYNSLILYFHGAKAASPKSPAHYNSNNSTAAPNKINQQAAGKVQLAYECLQASKLAGLTELVPSYSSLWLSYDALHFSQAEIQKQVSEILETSKASQQRKATKTLRIAVCYQLGEDWLSVCRQTGLTQEAIIKIHMQRIYKVYAIGFLPGFAYLGILDPRLHLKRLKTPRKHVPAGSVAIAGEQTAVYPLASPGGWHLIGKTTMKMFDPALPGLCPLEVGDSVQFFSISKKAFLHSISKKASLHSTSKKASFTI